MKDKKGFTLVELLAVIAILAIIMLLIVPNIVKMFENGRKDAFIRQVQSVLKESEKQYAADLTVEEESLSYCDKDLVASHNCKILSLNATNIKYYVKINEEGIVTKIGVSDGNYCYYTNTANIEEIDRDSLVKGGTLKCSNNDCVCSGEVTNNSNATYVYWDDTLSIESAYYPDSYPTNALKGYSTLENTYIVRTKLGKDGTATGHELCVKTNQLFCMDTSYLESDQESTYNKLNNDLSKVSGISEVNCDSNEGTITCEFLVNDIHSSINVYDNSTILMGSMTLENTGVVSTPPM